MILSTRHIRRSILGLAVLVGLAVGLLPGSLAAHADSSPPSYIFRLDGFTINNTMSWHTDTDTVFFSVIVGRQLYGPYPMSMGDLNNGYYPVGLQTPPIPVDANTPVNVVYTIHNQGHDFNVDTATTVIANVLGSATDAALDIADVPVPFAGTLVTDGLQAAFGLLFANCDGTVLSDNITQDAMFQQTLNGADLAALINATNASNAQLNAMASSLPWPFSTVVATLAPVGTYQETRSYTGPNTADGCGSNAQYNVTWSVTQAPAQ